MVLNLFVGVRRERYWNDEGGPLRWGIWGDGDWWSYLSGDKDAVDWIYHAPPLIGLSSKSRHAVTNDFFGRVAASTGEYNALGAIILDNWIMLNKNIFSHRCLKVFIFSKKNFLF